MANIVNKKREFIKRHFKQFSIEELIRKTGLKPAEIGSLIDHYTAEIPGKDQAVHRENRAGIFPPWKIILLTALLFAVVTSIIYSPSFHGHFIFDDINIIQYNPLLHITSISQLPDLLFANEVGRKIGLMSFALNYYLGGFNTFGYHLVNVIIHILNGLTLFLLSHTILTLPATEEKERNNALMIAFLGSLLWLVHPIQTQAVSYIVQRLTSLSALFFLLSLLCYIKGRMNTSSQKKVVLFVLSTVLGLLALGTKQNAATLPLFIILSEFSFFQDDPTKIDRNKLIFLILAVGVFILIAWTYLESDIITKLAQSYEIRGWTPLERVLTQLRVVMFYLSLLIYPHPSRLNLDHDFALSHSLFSPFTTFLSLFVIAGALVLAITLMRKQRLVSYAIFWFFGNLVIESSIIPLELVFEHRLYLPSMGLIILFVGLCLVLKKIEWKKWVVSSLIPLIVLFSYWTYERATIWKGPISLWTDAIKKSPNKPRPHNNLGTAYSRISRLDEAISEYRQAITINPDYVEAHYNLGDTYIQKGRLDEAISACKKAIEINPNLTKAYNNLGLAYSKKGMLDEAISEYRHAIISNPDYEEAHYNLGLAYDKKGMIDQAISECKKALDINPDYVDAHFNLGLFYDKKGMIDQAISECKKVLDINPHYVDAHFNLGLFYDKKGESDKAISAYKKTLAIEPRFAKALNNLGIIYGKQGELERAISLFKEVLALKPDYGEAHNNLSFTYYFKGNYKSAIVHHDRAVELRARVNPQLSELLEPYR